MHETKRREKKIVSSPRHDFGVVSDTVKLNEICTEALVAFHGGVVRVDRVGTT